MDRYIGRSMDGWIDGYFIHPQGELCCCAFSNQSPLYSDCGTFSSGPSADPAYLPWRQSTALSRFLSLVKLKRSPLRRLIFLSSHLLGSIMSSGASVPAACPHPTPARQPPLPFLASHISYSFYFVLCPRRSVKYQKGEIETKSFRSDCV